MRNPVLLLQQGDKMPNRLPGLNSSGNYCINATEDMNNINKHFK